MVCERCGFPANHLRNGVCRQCIYSLKQQKFLPEFTKHVTDSSQKTVRPKGSYEDPYCKVDSAQSEFGKLGRPQKRVGLQLKLQI